MQSSLPSAYGTLPNHLLHSPTICLVYGMTLLILYRVLCVALELCSHIDETATSSTIRHNSCKASIDSIRKIIYIYIFGSVGCAVYIHTKYTKLVQGLRRWNEYDRTQM